LKVEEGEFRDYMANLPFGKKYLIARESLVSLESYKPIPVDKKIEDRTEQKKITNSPEAKVTPIELEEPKKEIRLEPVELRETPKLEAKYTPRRPEETKREILSEPGEVRETPKDEKGTTRHQYLQNLIKRLAEEHGYKATIEEPIPDGVMQFFLV